MKKILIIGLILGTILLVLFLIFYRGSCPGCLVGEQNTVSLVSGIHGHVVMKENCKTLPASSTESCDSNPHQASFEIIDAQSGKKVATTTSNTDGLFEVVLPVGEYVVNPVTTPGSIARVTSQNAFVKEGAYTDVQVEFRITTE